MTAAAEVRPDRDLPPVPLANPVQRATVVVVTILDITGVLLAVAAAAVLIFNEEADRRWWWVVGLAAFLAMVTTVLLIWIEDQRRTLSQVEDRRIALENAAAEAEEKQTALQGAVKDATDKQTALQDTVKDATDKHTEQPSAPDPDHEFLEVFEKVLQDVKNTQGPAQLPDYLREWARRQRDAADTRGYHQRAYDMNKALIEKSLS